MKINRSVIPAHAAGVGIAIAAAGHADGHAACIVAVRYRTLMTKRSVIPAHAAGVEIAVTSIFTVHGTCIVAVPYCAAVEVIPAHASEACRVSYAGHAAGVVAVLCSACVQPAHPANVSVGIVAGHAAAETAVRYRASVVPTHAAGSADPLAVAYIAVSDLDVLHPAIAADVAEQAHIIAAAAVVQPADGVTVSVEGAGVFCIIVVPNLFPADGRPLGEAASAVAVDVASVVQHVLVDGDVRRQLGVGRFVLLHFAADDACIPIHQSREPVELPGVADLVDAVDKRRGFICAAGAEAVVVGVNAVFVAGAVIMHPMFVVVVQNGEVVRARDTQILPPGAIHLSPAVQQPGHLAGFEFIVGFGNSSASAAAAAAADAAAGLACEPIAVRYCAVPVSPAHAADDVIAGHAAGVVAVRYHAVATVVPAHASDIVTVAATTHITCVVAVRYHAAATVVPAHAADDVYSGTVAGHAACVAAIRYRAVVPTAHAADVIDYVTVAVHAAVEAAVRYRAAVVPAHAAGDAITVAAAVAVADIAVSDVDILHLATTADVAEQADIVAAAAVVQPADGLIIAVEGTGVGVAVIADGRPLGEAAVVQASVRFQHARVDSDVIRQHGVGVIVAFVHRLRKPVELHSGGYLVGIIRRTAASGQRRRSAVVRRRSHAQRAQAQGYRKYQYEQFFHTLYLLSSGPMGHSHCCAMRKRCTPFDHFILHYPQRQCKK